MESNELIKRYVNLSMKEFAFILGALKKVTNDLQQGKKNVLTDEYISYCQHIINDIDSQLELDNLLDEF